MSVLVGFCPRNARFNRCFNELYPFLMGPANNHNLIRRNTIQFGEKSTPPPPPGGVGVGVGVGAGVGAGVGGGGGGIGGGAYVCSRQNPQLEVPMCRCCVWGVKVIAIL